MSSVKLLIWVFHDLVMHFIAQLSIETIEFAQ